MAKTLTRTLLAAAPLAAVPLALAIAGSQPALASTVPITFSAPGISGSLLLTYGSATDAKYASAFEITGVSGSFTDTNNGLGIVDAAVAALVAINYATPESTNLLAPHDFSKFTVASGLPLFNHGTLTYDNLFWPTGSVQTASDYPFSGGFLDIYGLMFQLPDGAVADLWSNGVVPGKTAADYGVAVADSQKSLDYVAGGVAAAVPEPGSFALLAAGLVLLAVNLAGRHAARRWRAKCA